MKRERRRIQEQLRRIKRNEEKLNQATASPGSAMTPVKKKKKENAKDIKVLLIIDICTEHCLGCQHKKQNCIKCRVGK